MVLIHYHYCFVEAGTYTGALKRVKKITHLDLLLKESETEGELLAMRNNDKLELTDINDTVFK